jgi:hypothetical protein
MCASNIPITNGQGQSSVAAEEIATVKYQQIKVVGGETGSTSVMGVNPDRSINVSVIGLSESTPFVGTFAASDGVAQLTAASTSDSETLAPFGAANYVYNGTNWEMWRGNSSVGARVTTGNTSVITILKDSSIIGVITGSVIAIPTGNQSVSGTVGASVIGTAPVRIVSAGNGVLGNWNSDGPATSGDVGVVALGWRNDNLASITSGTNEYSQIAVGPVGEQVVVDAPFTKWVSGVADLRVVQGASVTAIGAQGSSVFTYVREVQVANFGSASVLVKIAGGLGSTLGWTIAPAGGGSNFVTRYRTGENSAVTASINGTASVLVTLSGFTARI